MDNPGEKKCSKCGEIKPKIEFYKDSTKKGGLKSCCKLCDGGRLRNYRRTKAGKKIHREKNSRWYQSRGKRLRRQKRKDAPEKDRARGTVYRAVRDGRLPKVKTLNCEDCGGSANHYHHESYKKEHWLDVIPLCSVCHSARHNIEQVATQPQTKQLSLF
jgi:hypothetical protein